MLTQDDLNMIKERAKKATPGPWYLAYTTDGALLVKKNGDIIAGTCTEVTDAEFIKTARKYIPQLVAEIDRLRESIKTAERELWWGSPESACIRVSDLLKEALESDD